jgi:hypothetical protein
MILDERLEFADAASVVNAAGTFLLGDVVPLSVARDIGGGEDGQLYLVVQVDTALDSAGEAATVVFKLVSDAQAAIATDGTASVHAVSETFTEAQLDDVGKRVWVCPVPPQSDAEPYETYLGVIYTIGTEALTAGAVSAFLTRDIGSKKVYSSPSQYV